MSQQMNYLHGTWLSDIDICLGGDGGVISHDAVVLTGITSWWL